MQRFALVVSVVLAAACGDKRNADYRTESRPTDGDRSVPMDTDKKYRDSTPSTPVSPPADTDRSVKDADNTDRNKRDKDGLSTTPGDQGSSDADVRRTADIRKRVVDLKVSTNGQNVKIVTLNGRVTLRGPVKSQSEKDQIVRAARDVAGDANVDDQLEVEMNR